MPTEMRRLIFSEQETLDALTAFVHSGRTSIEPGQVISFEVTQKDPAHVRCRVQGKSGRQTTEDFDEVFLCAALISWCMGHQVPLARGGKKAVRITHDGRLAMDVTL